MGPIGTARGNPMVLHLSRGGFDPKEHQFVRRLVDAYPEIRYACTRLVFISTDNQLNNNEFRDERRRRELLASPR